MDAHVSTPNGRSSLRTIDLFSGAGGLTLGFEQATRNADSGIAYEPLLAVEHDDAAARTYERNFGVPVLTQDIETLDVESYPDADVILAGPPCQGFSPLGRGRDLASRAALNQLWEHCAAVIRQVQPMAFVIENVPQFHRSAEFERLLSMLRTDDCLAHYGTTHGILNSADYGVPQTRKRGFLVGIAGSSMQWPPHATHGRRSPDGNTHVAVREAISDLPLAPTTDQPTRSGTGQDLHIRRHPWPSSLERYKAVPEGGNRFDLQRNRPDLTPPCWANKPTGTTDVMGRLWWDRPAQTIRTEFYKPEKGRYLHPVADRAITHREAARLQSFPDDFWFEGSKIEIARQIGNAVPPLLAKTVALHLAGMLVQADAV